MIIPKSLEEFATYVEKGQSIFFFTAQWCGDCRFIHPIIPELEAEFSDFQWIEIDRDKFIDVCAEWGIFGIPSFIAIKDGQELGRLVNKNRKTKEEIQSFIQSLPTNK
ncbi:thioredoxin family protein [Enterococcus lemanii]|uniref:Thioredoxin family protein n=1 Tax=Enterococcus lemanii TaxID=1159752 RepID=A0ABV9MYX5_9ENTE|nr:thioredoxin family protein [Enterococcus lemanii]MBM7709888.1 thiol-disulfide isomerase/thioredoxin [Enterococcus lemanii]